MGHFGSYGDDVAQELAPVLIALLSADEAVRVLLVGRNSGAFADKLLKGRPECAGRVHASGVLPQLDVVAALKACAVLVQPFPDGVTTRRTSVMAGLAAGVATVTTSGRLTERVWRDSDAAVLVPAGSVEAMRDAALGLLQHPSSRQERATAGQRVYGERFAIDRSVDVLTGA